MTLSTRRKIVAAALEATAGTAETLDNTDTAFYGFDPNIQNNVQFTTRTGAGLIEQVNAVPGVEAGQITFATEMYQAAPWAPILMPALGFVAAGTNWTPSSVPSNFKTATVGYNMAGKLKTLAAAMFSARFLLNAGQPVRVEWTGTGRYQAEADATQFTPAYATPDAYTSAPKFAGATTTLNGTAICWANGVLEIQNTVSLILCQNSAGGIHRAWVEDRRILFTIDPLEELAATRNDDALQRSRAEQTLVVAFGNMSITADECQRLEISPGERNGLSAQKITLQANATSGGTFTIDFDTAD